MKLRMILATGLLVATAAAAQERAARPTAVFAPAEPAPAPEAEPPSGRLAEPALELGADERRAMEQARDLRQLKADMVAVRQMLQNQQSEIDQLRTCLKLHDERLTPRPLASGKSTGSMDLASTLTVYTGCKL